MQTHKCSYCGKECKVEVEIVDNVPLKLSSKEYFCNPVCMAAFISSSPHSFMACDGCGRFIRAYNEDLKQLLIIKNKLLCLDCYYELLFRFGQPLQQLISKPPQVGITKHFHSSLLKEHGFYPMAGAKAIKDKKTLTAYIPQITEMYRQRFKIIIKENQNNTYTIWVRK